MGCGGQPDRTPDQKYAEPTTPEPPKEGKEEWRVVETSAGLKLCQNNKYPRHSPTQKNTPPKEENTKVGPITFHDIPQRHLGAGVRPGSPGHGLMER